MILMMYRRRQTGSFVTSLLCGKAGESFSAAHIVGYFDSIGEMHAVYDRDKGHTALTADSPGWRLVK